MLKKIKFAAVSALVALGTLAAAPASASSGVYLGLGGGHHGPSVGVWFGEGGRSYHRDYRRDYRRPHYRSCSAEQAVRKASRMGIRHAHVRNANRNVIRVAGRSRGDHVVVRFARAPGCPVIGW
jgi:hypothetical protein